MNERFWSWLSIVALAIAVVAAFSAQKVPADIPAPDAPSYIALAESLASGDGYRLEPEGPLAGEQPGSRYPPGFPIVLAIMSPLFDATDAVLLLGAALMVAAWHAARVVGGPIAASVAVLLLAAHLPDHRLAGAVMPDLTGALFVVLALIAVHRNRPRLAGVLVGLGAWVRLAHLAVVVGLQRRAVASFAVVVALLGVTKLAWHWGYVDGQAEWSVSHIWSLDGVNDQMRSGMPNAFAYAGLLAGVVGSMLPPGVVVLAGLAVWRRPERRLVLGTSAGLLALYLPYYFQDERFLFPVVVLVAIYTGAWCADAVARFADPAPSSQGIRGPMHSDGQPGGTAGVAETTPSPAT